MRGRASWLSNSCCQSALPLLDVLRLVHHTHSAATELLKDAVVRNGLADERLGLRHLPSMLGRWTEASQRIGSDVAAPFRESERVRST